MPFSDAVIVRGPRDYVELPRIPNDWRVLDIGPGRYPLRRADMYLDNVSDNFDAAEIPHEHRILGDLESGLPEIPDKAFDYVWCSHVLEHVNDPAACAATISRIGKSGTVVLPSAVKEALFNFEEVDHHWLIHPHPRQGEAPVFVRHNDRWLERVKNIDIQKINCRLYRTGTNRDDLEDNFMRNWFFVVEPDLDIVFHWSGFFRPTVIA